MGEINGLAVGQRAELNALARKAETGEQWAEVCRREAEMLAALKAAHGYLLNAAIDLETGAKRATALNTINGDIQLIRSAIAKAQAAESSPLMAAAPDLYRALTYAAEIIRDRDGGNPADETGWADPDMMDAWLSARAALAKAEGRS